MHRITRTHVAFLITAVGGVIVTGSGCPPQGGLSEVLVDRTVTVAAAGGFADVTFEGVANTIVRFTLAGTPTAMEPYGILHPPTGTAIDAPPIGTATNGRDEATITLPVDGQYTYTVFDGANLGGTVAVKIEVIGPTL